MGLGRVLGLFAVGGFWLVRVGLGWVSGCFRLAEGRFRVGLGWV